MRRDHGFTLVEIMVSMSIGLILLSALMTFWIALSKASHKEIIKLELSQNYLDVVSYLRSTLGRAIIEPHCLNPEWITNSNVGVDDPLVNLLSRKERLLIHKGDSSEALFVTTKMKDATLQYPDLWLGNYRLKTLEGSDLIELLYLTPLDIKDGIIQNDDEIKGGRFGDVFVTDCHHYILGEYYKNNAGRYFLSDQLGWDVARYLSDSYHLQYYKINRVLIYVAIDQGRYYLIYNFLDGSNFIRFADVEGLKVDLPKDEDLQLLQFYLLIPVRSKNMNKVVQKDFYLRMFGL